MDLTEAHAHAVGKRMGDWIVAQPLGAGGMGELYLAARPSKSHGVQVVALKQLLPHLCWDPEFVRMFVDEVRLASGLDHPNIVRVLDWGTGTGGHWFVMEYVHGEDLGHVLTAFGERPSPLELAVGIVAELADGLHYAHEYRSPDGGVHGVIHRDVTPSNVRIGFDGSVKLLDFGIARVASHTQATRGDAMKGKIGYMSPEQCAGDPVDRRTDVFALGVLLYELTLARRAFYAPNDFAVVAKILEGDFIPPLVVDPYYPPALAGIVARALRVDREDRYATAQDMALALRDYAAKCGLDLHPHRRAEWMRSLFGDRPWPRVDIGELQRGPPQMIAAQRRRRVLRLGALAAGAATVGLVGYFAGTMSSGDAAKGEPAASEAEERRGVESPAAEVADDPVGAAAELAGPEPEPLDGDPGPQVDAEAPNEAEPLAPAEPEDVAAVEVEDDPPDSREATPPHRPRRRRPKSPPPASKDDPPPPPGKGEELLPPSWQG